MYAPIPPLLLANASRVSFSHRLKNAARILDSHADGIQGLGGAFVTGIVGDCEPPRSHTLSLTAVSLRTRAPRLASDFH